MNDDNVKANEYVDALDNTVDSCEPPVEEFEDTEDPSKPFRFEYAHEALTESHTRFKRRGTQ